jgi:hypothetical protein
MPQAYRAPWPHRAASASSRCACTPSRGFLSRSSCSSSAPDRLRWCADHGTFVPCGRRPRSEPRRYPSLMLGSPGCG